MLARSKYTQTLTPPGHRFALAIAAVNGINELVSIHISQCTTLVCFPYARLRMLVYIYEYVLERWTSATAGTWLMCGDYAKQPCVEHISRLRLTEHFQMVQKGTCAFVLLSVWSCARFPILAACMVDLCGCFVNGHRCVFVLYKTTTLIVAERRRWRRCSDGKCSIKGWSAIFIRRNVLRFFSVRSRGRFHSMNWLQDRDSNDINYGGSLARFLFERRRRWEEFVISGLPTLGNTRVTMVPSN